MVYSIINVLDLSIDVNKHDNNGKSSSEISTCITWCMHGNMEGVKR